MKKYSILGYRSYWDPMLEMEKEMWGTSLVAYLSRYIQFYNKLRGIVPSCKTHCTTNLFISYAGIMALSGFGPYHGLWCYDAPSKRIIVTPTLGVMISALGLVSIPPKPAILPYFLECCSS
jgi:hypothetical protein